MKNENTKANNENAKAGNENRGEAAAKQDPWGDDAKYTRLAFLRAVGVLNDAADCGFFDDDLAERVREEAVIEKCEDCPGTWFVCWRAKTWREAAAFAAAIVGAAFARGYYADPQDGWDAGLDAEDGGRFVDVFVAAADFMMDDGEVARGGPRGLSPTQQDKGAAARGGARGLAPTQQDKGAVARGGRTK